MAQDLAWYGRDAGEHRARSPRCSGGSTRSPPTASRGSASSTSIPSEVRDPLVATMLELPTVVPYFDLSLQHADARLLAAHEAVGERRPLPHQHRRHPRARSPTAAFRSSFIVGFPGEGEREHDELLAFLQAAALDWAGFFPFSPEDGTPAADAPDAVDAELAVEWLRECEAVQEPITRAARDALVGRRGRGARRHRRRRRQRSSVAPTVKRRRSTASCGCTPTGRVRAHWCARTSPRPSVPTWSPRRRVGEHA